MSKLGGNPLWEGPSNLMKKWFYTRQLITTLRKFNRFLSKNE